MKKLTPLFQSSNNYFRQPPAVLQENRQKIKYYLEEIKGYEPQQSAIYLKAYDYFVAFPEDFDGATKTEDLYDIPGLELGAMLHDYLYVNLNASGNFKYRFLVDRLFRSEMRRMGKSTWNGGARFVLLLLAFVPHSIFTYLFRNRRMSAKQKTKVKEICFQLQVPEKIWHKEYRGEIVWFLIVLVVLFAVLL